MSKGRQGAREKRARKYFRGGTMPDGLELFPLNGGKLEIMQEIMEASAEDDLSEDDLGYCMMMLYASQYSDIKDTSIQDLAEGGRDIGRNATLEDRQAAEDVILTDFDALSASVSKSPKPQALRRAEPSHSNGQTSSGPDLPSDTPETKLKQSAPSRSSRSALPKATPIGETGTRLSGPTQTGKTSRESGNDLSDSGRATG